MPSTLASPIAASGPNRLSAGSSTPTRSRRIGAFAIDLLVVVVLTAVAILLSPESGSTERGISGYTLLSYVPAAYLLFRDTIAGRSLGKLATGLVVWDDATGRPAGFMDSIIRNAPVAVLLIPVGGPLVQGMLWPLYIVKLVAAMLCVTMLWQILRQHPRRILEGPATTHVIDARARH